MKIQLPVQFQYKLWTTRKFSLLNYTHVYFYGIETCYIFVWYCDYEGRIDSPNILSTILNFLFLGSTYRNYKKPTLNKFKV